jgi:hypothetical protein
MTSELATIIPSTPVAGTSGWAGAPRLPTRNYQRIFGSPLHYLVLRDARNRDQLYSGVELDMAFDQK